jgi:hypothetical protein
LVELSDGVQVLIKPKPNVNIAFLSEIAGVIDKSLIQMTITSDFVEIVGKVESATMIDPHNWYKLKVENRTLPSECVHHYFTHFYSENATMDIADKLVNLIHRPDLRKIFYE